MRDLDDGAPRISIRWMCPIAARADGNNNIQVPEDRVYELSRTCRNKGQHSWPRNDPNVGVAAVRPMREVEHQQLLGQDPAGLEGEHVAPADRIALGAAVDGRRCWQVPQALGFLSLIHI